MAALPARVPLPRYLAPLPARLEDLGLRLALPIALVNLVGTAFGFWYYGIHPFEDPIVTGQFAFEPVAMWALVPDSPVATLFIGLSLLLWWLGRPNEYVNVLAFFGCIKLGAWTPFVLLAFADGFSYLHVAMFNFLFWSHLAMVLEAFVLHRYSDFPVAAIAVAVGWYGLNDLVDYFVPVIGGPHHTWIPPQFVDGAVTHPAGPHALAAAAAVALTVFATAAALATRARKAEAARADA
ncbi:MAG: DUF1405 domain-containing protein [Halobacteriales archaeon]|nr:DUF1405 domain-containing protein [Halobacteriales archaeon]